MMNSVVVSASAALVLAFGVVSPASSAPVPTSPDLAKVRWHLDETFGTEGMVITEDPGGGDYFPGGQIVVQPDGKIVVASASDNHEVTLLRFLASGELDVDFGDNGVAGVPDPGSSGISRIALQTVGDQTKVVTVQAGSDRTVDLWRFNEDGTLDTDHDGDPTVVFGRNGHARLTSPRWNFFMPRVTVGPDQSLFIADSGWRHFPKRPMLVKTLRDGALDADFGREGFVVLPHNGELYDSQVVTADDGTTRVLVAGSRMDKGGSRVGWLLAGLTESGELDPTYGVGGYLDAQPPTPKRNDGEIYRIHVEPSGGAILDGFSRPNRRFAVTYARVDPSGQLDTAYGHDGWAYPVEPGTKKYWAGQSERVDDGVMLWAGGDNSKSDPKYFGGLRPDGSADPRFGPDGYLVVELPHFGDDPPDNRLDSIAIDAEGRILMASSLWVDGHRDRFALVRLTTEPSHAPTDGG